MDMRHHPTARNPVLLMTCGLILANVLGSGCSRKQTAEPPKVANQDRSVKDDVATPNEQQAPLRQAKKPKVQPPKPLTDEAILAMRRDIEGAGSYPVRLEARRRLFYTLCKHDRHVETMPELTALLDDIERQEGRAMAQRAAFSDAGNLVDQGRHHAALAALHLLLGRDGDGPFAADALMHIGSTHLKLKEYVKAEQAWQRLIEEYDHTTLAPWGWRKLALVQLLQGRYELSLSTLEVMASKYEDTHFGEYARMRRGYVLMAANRVAEARASHESFLKECANSKYCRLAKKQLAEMDEAIALAKAGQRQ